MTFYVTTPIYYVNDTPHIGHAYTTIVADVLARYHRLFGEDTFFLTGTDEHGQKVQNAAKTRNLTPQEHVDELVLKFKAAWAELDIKSDFFIRTTMDVHKKVVQDSLQYLFESGDIYTQDYEGWYSVSEEIFYTEKDLIDGKSPTGKEVTKITERNYFFRMSNYQQRLIDHINANPSFILPIGKRSEVIGFLKQPLSDLCISRPKSRLNWGIELPFDKEFVTYVWFDALLNYATAVGFKQGAEKQPLFNKWWPHAIHLIGKDILITHAVYWPTMLMALKAPLPKTIFAHGWWLTPDNKKMSKSEGPVVKPLDMKDVVGVDALRYYLVRDIYFGNDGQFSKELVVTRINSDLANNLGNLLNRSTNIIAKNFEAKVPDCELTHPESLALRDQALALADQVERHIKDLIPNLAVETIMTFLSSTNKYIDTLAPWKTVKEKPKLAAETLYVTLESLRIAATLLLPVMPQKMTLLLEQLGLKENPTFAQTKQWGLLEPGSPLGTREILFPKIDLS